MKKKTQTQEPVIETTEAVVIENLVEAVVTEKRRGRPVVEGSRRQLELAAKMIRLQMNGGIVKRGRPIVSESKRQLVMAERAAKLAAGIEIKRGRPKMKVVVEQ